MGNREYPEKTTLNHKKNDSINKQEKIKGLKYKTSISECLLFWTLIIVGTCQLVISPLSYSLCSPYLVIFPLSYSLCSPYLIISPLSYSLMFTIFGYSEKTTLNHKKNDSINKQEKIKGLKYKTSISECLLFWKKLHL
jgi:hypothetical protein